MKRGPKTNERRDAYIRRFRLVVVKPSRMLPCALLDQLDACADDLARRLLLGVSEKEKEWLR